MKVSQKQQITRIKRALTFLCIALTFATSLVVNATEANIYRYCPTIINENIFYCSNQNTPGEIKDGIYLNDKQVLSTTKGAWDSKQVCDPSVVEGKFMYHNNNYKYLMAYLGCATLDNSNNEIGFAVSNDLYTWIKTGKVISYRDKGYWGVGQPSLLNINNNLLLFYTSGDATKTTTYVEYLDASDLSNVKHLDKYELTTTNDIAISNADFAYKNGALYMTCDTHTDSWFPEGVLSNVSAAQSIYTANWSGEPEDLASLNKNSWTLVKTIDSVSTGHDRNHNAGFVRDGVGNLIEDAVYVTTADEISNSWLKSLYTYRFQKIKF